MIVLLPSCMWAGSHPTRVRGLKSPTIVYLLCRNEVAPHPGAWIEIMLSPRLYLRLLVAPHPGAWIEICLSMDVRQPRPVAPHPGAWIEILSNCFNNVDSSGRTPCGCVD